MTEDEAKTKICHRSIDGDDSPAPVIGNEMFAKKFACIGSACMAWRSDKDMFLTEKGNLINPEDGRRGDLRGVYVKQGFCGLAGKP